MSVASQTISITDLRTYAFTRDRVLDGIADHVYSHDPAAAIFLDKTLGDFGTVRLRGMGRRDQRGAASVQCRVRLGEHTGSKRMAGGWDTHSTSPDDNARLGQANWMHYSGALVISDTDKDVNQGEEAMADFVADQTEAVMLSLVQMVASDLQTASSAANAVTSFATLIGANESTSVQGLTPTSYANYHSRGLSARGTAQASVSFTSGSFAAQGISDLRTLRLNCTEGMVGPNVIITEHATYNRYEGALQPQERFAGAVGTADASFNALSFHQIPMLASPNTPSGYLYMLMAGPNGMQVVNLSGKSFRFMPFKPGSNQETHVSELQWKGQVVIRNRLYGCNKMSSISD